MALVKRSLTVGGHRTSVALEEQFWRTLEAIAERRGISMPRLVAEIDEARAHNDPLASALRVHALVNR
jgi:predicted DNA-binding ribbon-helix-helix protein